MPLREETFAENIISRSLFGYVQCDFEVPENLREVFANFPPIFRNIIVGTDDIGPIMKEYAEKERILTQPKRMLISSYFLESGTIITPLLRFYLNLGLVCKNFYRLGNIFRWCASTTLFNLRSMLEQRERERERDQNPNSTVVAETMKLLANISYGYQIMNRSHHSVSKYLSDEKTHGAINNKMLKCLG